MPRGKRFDKKTAKTFSVVHRSHEDALYYDNDASKHVLVEAPQRRDEPSHKAYTTKDIAAKLSPEELASIRNNEGLASQYGILYDDSKYDYMQHLRPIGQGDGVFIEAEADKPKPSRIEDLIKDALPSEAVRKVTVDDTENIPRELRGFNPDMDPRLREVLEALEDEAYVENDVDGDEDIFGALLQSGEAADDEDDEDEWDMDNFSDEYEAYDHLDYEPEHVEQENPYNEGEAPEDAGAAAVDTAWEKDFMKFKHASKHAANDWDSDNEFDDEEEQDAVGELPAIAKKKNKNRARKKMGAMTDTSSFSMLSSALFRTEGLTLLDDRYEQLAKKFEEEPEEQQGEFDLKNERQDFEGMLDDFLENYETERGGRKLVRKNEKVAAIKEAADSVSKSKLAERRRKEAMDKLGGSFGKLAL